MGFGVPWVQGSLSLGFLGGSSDSGFLGFRVPWVQGSLGLGFLGFRVYALRVQDFGSGPVALAMCHRVTAEVGAGRLTNEGRVETSSRTTKNDQMPHGHIFNLHRTWGTGQTCLRKATPRPLRVDGGRVESSGCRVQGPSTLHPKPETLTDAYLNGFRVSGFGFTLTKQMQALTFSRRPDEMF